MSPIAADSVVRTSAPRVPERVILVHGLYFGGRWLGFLARHLLRQGFSPSVYAYPSVRGTPAQASDALMKWLPDPMPARVHFVAHSLGGLVLRHLFGGAHSLSPGRVVTLGTPHRGSHVAGWMAGHGLGALLGGANQIGLTGPVPEGPEGRELGSLAGNVSLGLGRLLPGLPEPNDGTVAVAETWMRGMSDHITLPVTHTGMLFSREVAEQCAAFLTQGRFRHGPAK